MTTYKPKSLRAKEHKEVQIAYGIGFLVSDEKFKDEWSMVGGPYPEIETALDHIGSEGEFILRLSGNPDEDKALWEWDDAREEWIEL